MDIEKEPMYTKSTFPEMEKMEAANSMLARIILLEKDRTSPTESFRKELLYDLAAMNSMVPKGYGPQTSADTLIYSVKQIACEAIARKWAERCRYYQGWSTHGSILYVYAGGRQYSFHVNLYDFDLPAAKYEEWDHIEKSWALTDEEYARERRARTAERLNTDGALREYQTYREERLKNYKVAKEYIRNRQKRKRLEERFWEVLLSVLPPAK